MNWSYQGDNGPSSCPFCGSMLMRSGIGDEARYQCYGTSCPFAASPELQAVYTALVDSAWSIEDAAAMCNEHMADAPERFKVNSAETANWVLKQIGQAQERMDEADRQRDAEKSAIDARAEKIKRADAQTLQFFQAVYGPQIEAWASEDRTTWGKKKSRPLLFGKIGFRAVAGKVVLDDEQQALMTGMTLDQERFTTLALKPAEIKKDLEDPERSGLWEGVAHIEGKGEKFYIEPELPAKAA